MAIEKLLVDVAEICAERRTGAAAATVSVNVEGEPGVRLYPPLVLKDGVMAMVLATVPVWSLICGEIPLNRACVAFAGTVKLTVRPPLPNCTAGSAANESDVTASVSVPVSAMGYGADSASPMAGC